MLLTRLVEYAAATAVEVGAMTAPPYYKLQRVRWVLELNADGSLVADILTPLAIPDDPVQKNGVEFVIPSITKTSGIAPKIAVDTPEYMFGWAPENG